MESLSLEKPEKPTSMKTLVAFHNDPKIQTKFRARIHKHQVADQLVQGYGYYKDGKGCAVGCTLDSNAGDHGAYERELGIPRVLAILEDRIFENLPQKEARLWPARFLEAPKLGADLSLVAHHFTIWLLTSPDSLYSKVPMDDADRKIMTDVAALYSRFVAGDKPKDSEWEEVEGRASAASTRAWDEYWKALALALARARALALDRARDLARDRARALALDLALALARDRAIDLALDLDLDLDLDLALVEKFFGLAAEKLLQLMSEADDLIRASETSSSTAYKGK
jgi:hypothetical protein